jgi:tetratricopeptide (TPR) repeat protein
VDDYYDLVGVDRTASREAIDRKIRDQLRLWQRRTSSADLDRRQAAERRVAQLSEARSTLLDEEKRRRYDRQLGAYRSSDLPRPAVPAGGASTRTDPSGAVDRVSTDNWLDQARGYLARSDHHSAAYAARETLRSTPNPPTEAWTLLARANTGLGRLDDALFEARRATTIEPRDVDAHLALARVHEQRREWLDASRAFETAASLDPAAETPHLGMARSLARSGRGRTALMEVAEEAIRPRGGAGRSGGAADPDLDLAQRLISRVRQVTTDHDVLVRANRLAQEVSRRRHPWRGTATSTGFTLPTVGGYRRDGEPRINRLAITSLIMSLLMVPPVSTTGAILGHIARQQIQQLGELGEGRALAGIIVGWAFTVLFCCGGGLFMTAMS